MLDIPVQNRPKLDRAAQQRIGERLKRMYEGLADMPVPDRLLELIGQLNDKAAREAGHPAS
jgi:hypothetical protein